jgi:hypothetical protein
VIEQKISPGLHVKQICLDPRHQKLPPTARETLFRWIAVQANSFHSFAIDAFSQGSCMASEIGNEFASLKNPTMSQIRLTSQCLKVESQF